MDKKISPIDLCQASGASLSLIYSLVWSGKVKAVKNERGNWQIDARDAASFLKTRKAKQGAGDGRGEARA